MDPKRPVILALFFTILSYWTANFVELGLIRVIHPSEIELTWISDLILAIALGLTTYLWLHLKATRKELADTERRRIAFDTELSLGAEIQRDQLPKMPDSLVGIRWAARLVPAGKIGGDFYDLVCPDEHSVLVLIGDVSGKGIPAALMLTSVRLMFRLFSRETLEPSQLVERLSRELYLESSGSMYLTCIVVYFELASKRITFTNAGHPPAVVLQSGARHYLETGGVPAGMFPSSLYTSKALSLQSGALGVLYTDGISEALEGNGQSPCDILATTLATQGKNPDPQRICDKVIALAQESAGPTGDGEWNDDKTILAFVTDS